MNAVKAVNAVFLVWVDIVEVRAARARRTRTVDKHTESGERSRGLAYGVWDSTRLAWRARATRTPAGAASRSRAFREGTMGKGSNDATLLQSETMVRKVDSAASLEVLNNMNEAIVRRSQSQRIDDLQQLNRKGKFDGAIATFVQAFGQHTRSDGGRFCRLEYRRRWR